MAAAASALATLNDIENSLDLQGVQELDHVDRRRRDRRGTRCLDRMMLSSRAIVPGLVQDREGEGQGAGRRSRPPYDGDVEARTAELHQRLNALEKEIAALYENEHLPCPDEISMKRAEARKVGRQLYTLRSGHVRSAYALRSELGAGTGACEAMANSNPSMHPWGAAPSYSNTLDRWIWHARALCASYNPFKLTQIFSAAHLHGYAVVYRKQGALLHIQAQETSVVTPLAFTIGLSVSQQPPRTGEAYAARSREALPFEVMLYGLPAGEQRRPAHLGELVSRAISHLQDYVAIRASQGLAADVIEAHEIYENGHKMLVVEDEDVEATQGLFHSQLALSALYYHLCHRTTSSAAAAAAAPAELPRLVQVYLDPSDTGGRFAGAILQDRHEI